VKAERDPHTDQQKQESPILIPLLARTIVLIPKSHPLGIRKQRMHLMIGDQTLLSGWMLSRFGEFLPRDFDLSPLSVET